MRTLSPSRSYSHCTPHLLAADWPQYRGPNRDDVSPETGLLKAWPKDGPPLAWTFEAAGVGYSPPAVVGDRVYVTGGREDKEVLIALDMKAATTVKEAWAAEIGPTFRWKGNSWSAGPSATPTVDGDADLRPRRQRRSGLREHRRQGTVAAEPAEGSGRTGEPDRRRAEEPRLGLHRVAARGRRRAHHRRRRAEGNARRARQEDRQGALAQHRTHRSGRVHVADAREDRRREAVRRS